MAGTNIYSHTYMYMYTHMHTYTHAHMHTHTPHTHTLHTHCTHTHHTHHTHTHTHTHTCHHHQALMLHSCFQPRSKASADTVIKTCAMTGRPVLASAVTSWTKHCGPLTPKQVKQVCRRGHSVLLSCVTPMWTGNLKEIFCVFVEGK